MDEAWPIRDPASAMLRPACPVRHGPDPRIGTDGATATPDGRTGSGHDVEACRLPRRALLAATTLLAAPAAHAQRWPAGPVRVVACFAPGGANDLLGRLAANILGAAFGQAFVVENRPGAGGNLGMEAVARAAPDGRTLVVAAGAAAINHTLYRNLPFDLLRDFAPVTLLGVVPNVLAVHPGVPARDAGEFAVLARATPGGVTYGSAGIGTVPHLAMAMVLRAIGASGVHVPYRGSAPAVTDLVAGRVQALFKNLPPLAEPLRAGLVRGLGISTAARHPDFPDLPTVAEAAGLPGFEVLAWQSLLAPAGTPAEIVEAMAAALRVALSAGEPLAQVQRLGALPRPLAPAEMRAFLAAEVAKWGDAVRASGASVE